MRKITCCFLIIMIFLLFHSTLTASANAVDTASALTVARNRLMRDSKAPSYSVKGAEPYSGQNGNPLFYFVQLIPQGFIVVSASRDLPPVIAYSYNATTGHTSDYIRFVTSDLEKRMISLRELPIEILEKRHALWTHYLTGMSGQPAFQQWPEPGTTSTGGWLETNWTQDFPFNSMCPLDPLNGNRSIAGCPSVAMGMIVNFHKTTNQIVFTDADDYHHVYAGRNYWIDDDYIALDFPSFPMLNESLDTLEAHYLNAQTLTKSDKAAMVFACGVAAKQVYTSTGSGTFSVDQAFDAYRKFNFATTELLHDTDTSLYTRMAQNMMDTLPVHLAVVDPGWTTGHNVVVDGYNTDHYFHLNFGW
ncbi:MAG: C10 family peptidase, partial [Bacteroidota bacterium]